MKLRARAAFGVCVMAFVYECGKNCRWQMTGDGVIKLCEETGR